MFSTITTAPAKQSVGETIAVLSGRLSTATLLEDRRDAIRGLRSFAKQYPASVASGALRSLIGSLSKDGEDVDTVKLAMETLLMLFNPDKDSPEASEEIALWLADEFTQRQENITLLLDFLEDKDFYSRLYSLQLLFAILVARTERTEECILVAPMGMPRLVAVLDDTREAIRDEGLALLIDLTRANIDIQKLVAFEKGFERVFDIMSKEGGLAEGARVVEDCLVLLGNLLRLNSSNQSMFRDMGFVAKLGRLLKDCYKPSEDGQEISQWAEEQRNRNIYAILAVIRLFLVAGAVGTPRNQKEFLRDRVLENTLQLAFTYSFDLPIRSEALIACADMIRGNADLQETFAGLMVPSPLDNPPVQQAGSPRINGLPRIPTIDALLDIILAVNAPQVFNLRMAACTCLKAYFFNHAEARRHFLNIAIAGHKANPGEPTNILTNLLAPVPETLVADPYRYWFSSVLMLHLIHESPTTKALAMGVTEGDEENGEEVVTSIQTIASHLLRGATKSEEPRVIIGYLMLLLCWLFEDLDAVNDFLDEYTNLKGLIQAAVENPNGDVMVQGLSAMLIGVIYEFSTKDSPIPRATVREIIMTLMGRDRYVDKLSRLRSYPLMRDHEVLSQRHGFLMDEKLPDVFLDDTFVDFFKDNYSRILRAIDREPGFEISVVTNGVQKGISRELVDSLRAQLEEKERALQNLDVEKASLTSQLGQEQADHRRTKDASAADVARANHALEAVRAQLTSRERALQDVQGKLDTVSRLLSQEQSEHQRTRAEVTRLRSVNDGLQRNHEQELVGVRREHRAKEEQLTKQVESVRKAAESDAERVRRRSEAEKADFKATISRLEVDLMKANKAKSIVEEKVAELEGKIKVSAQGLEDAERRLRATEEGARKIAKELEEKETARQSIQNEVAEKEEERKSVQNELDDLLIVFSDLEEKVTKYKGRLKALGEDVSDGEDDEEDAGDDDNDDDEE